MKVFLYRCAAAAAMLLAVSCSEGNFLDTDMSEGGVNVSALLSELNIPSASFLQSEPVSGSLEFFSNYNWKAEVLQNWIGISNESDINLSGVTKAYSIPFQAEDNTGSTPRTATILISSSDKRLELKITQEAFKPTLLLASAAEVTVPCEGGEYEAEITSNTSWSVRTADGASAEITLISSNGVKSASFRFKVGSNLDENEDKTATIVISAPGCEDIAITVKQARYRV